MLSMLRVRLHDHQRQERCALHSVVVIEQQDEAVVKIERPKYRVGAGPSVSNRE